MITSREELKAQIKRITGSTFIQFVAETPVKMNKTGNPYIGATKVANISGQLGKDYSIAVNNQRAREDKEMDFIAQAPKGKLHTDCKHFLIDEKTGEKTYLVVYPSKKSDETKAEYPDKFYFEGKEISEELLKPFYPPFSANKSQGVAKVIDYKTYGFHNVLSMYIKALDVTFDVTETLVEQERTEANPETVNA
jgi:hypothetical protein